MMTSRLFILAMLAMAFIPIESWAVLGQQESVGSERVRNLVHGFKERVNDNRDYTTTIIHSEANIIREYSDANGIIFAVSWSGFSHPDLSQLLGEHWAEFKRQHDLPQNRHPRGSRALTIKTSTIQHEEGGRQGAVFGRSYIPSLVPEGVSVEELP